MQVYDIVKTYALQFPDQSGEIVIECMDPVNMRIGLDDRVEFFLSEVVDLSLRQLVFDASDYWCSQDNITNRAKPDYKYFLQ